MKEELPEGWAETTLAEITSPRVRQLTPEADSRITYIDIASVDNKCKSITEPKSVFGRDAPSRARQEVRPGDVLVSMTRPNLNAVAMVPSSLGICIASTGFHVLRPVEVLPEWLFAIVRSQQFVSMMSDLVQGALYPAVRPRDIREYRLPVPPLPEQRRIVAKIEELTARSRAAREALADVPKLLEQFRQSVLASAFRGDLTADWREQHPDVEPASVLLARIREQRRQQWEAKFPKKKYVAPEPVDESDLPELPEGWCWARWKELSEWVTYGFTRPMPHVASGIMIVTAKNIKNQGLTLDSVQYTTATAFESLSAKDKPNPGDILIIKDGATTGRCAVVPSSLGPFCINQSVAVVWLRLCPMNKSFLLRWIQAPFIQGLIQGAMAGNAMPHLSITDFDSFPVPVPSLAEQDVIATMLEGKLSCVDRLAQLIQEQVVNLQVLDQSILAKAFRGELVPQDPADEPASVLLERIRATRENGNGTTRANGAARRTGKGRRSTVADRTDNG